MSQFAYLLTYLGLAVFILAVLKRIVAYKRNPMHLRWELYPVAHEGGGISCDYMSSPTITNCILWGNGHEEISADASSYPVLNYCNVEGSWPGTGNIDVDPEFVLGPYGKYYLSQVSAGQPVDSPCVDAGSDSAENMGLDMLTTSNGSDPDAGTVDMGYHYPVYDGLYITWMARGLDEIKLFWKGKPGKCYVVEWSLNLEDWYDYVVNVPVEGLNNVWSWIDPCIPCFHKKYYRVREN